LQRRVLPVAGGVLLGIALFWILPEMAEDRGWGLSLLGVGAAFALLAWVDQKVYPLCPFCAAGVHGLHSHSMGWPLLAVGCLHSFTDGWAIGAPRAAGGLVALAWGATIHKLPESVAIGFLAARLTHSRRRALAVVALLQASMAAGGLCALLAGALDRRWETFAVMLACALLLLFGVLSLRDEWQHNGRISALRAAAPGVAGCALAAIAMRVLVP